MTDKGDSSVRVIGEARLHGAWFPCSGRRYRNAPSLLVVGFKQFSESTSWVVGAPWMRTWEPFYGVTLALL